MSSLAQQLACAPPVHVEPVRKGPPPVCAGVYPRGDMEDWQQVEAMRLATSWRSAQITVDTLLDVESPISNDKFRYHWRRRCGCWPAELRQA